MSENQNLKVIMLFNTMSVTCIEKPIALENIRGIEYGTKHETILTLPSCCFVKKQGKGYTLINIGDQRITQFIQAFDKKTKLVCLIVPDEVADKVEFYSNELLTQLTAPIPVEIFFKDLITDKKKQSLISNYFIKTSRQDNQLPFNLMDFSKLLGGNSPSISSLNRWKKEAVSPPTIKNNPHNFSDNDIYQNKNTFEVLQSNQKEQLDNKNTAEFIQSIKKEQFDDRNYLINLSLEEAYYNNNKLILTQYNEIWNRSNAPSYDLYTTIEKLKGISNKALANFFIKFEETIHNQDSFNILKSKVGDYIENKELKV